MSSLTLELIRDPELLRIAEQAYEEVHAEAIAQNRRHCLQEIADRIAELTEWRHRALRAETKLKRFRTKRR